MPCGATFSFVFTFELGLCITKMWCVSYKQSLLVGLGCVQPCHAPLVCLPLWHVSGHNVLLCLREKISVGRCFLPFFSASRHAHNFTCLMVCVYECSVHEYLCDHVCICAFVCVLLMTLFSPTLLGCQRGAGDCHTQQGPLLLQILLRWVIFQCQDRRFTLAPDRSRTRWTHYSLFACVASFRITSRRVQKAWAENLWRFSVLCYH